MQKLLIATRNQGKLREIKTMFKGSDFEILSMDDVGLPSDFQVEEPASTLEGNAIIKAMVLGSKTGLLTLTEDSGLEVDALNGRPGVHSARYAEGSDKDRYLKLLEELKDVPFEKRTARFKADIAIFDPISAKIRTCEGVYEGIIALEPVGENGFGYDPVFFNKEMGKTNAQMTEEEKNSISHRAKALEKAKEILVKEFSQTSV